MKGFNFGNQICTHLAIRDSDYLGKCCLPHRTIKKKKRKRKKAIPLRGLGELLSVNVRALPPTNSAWISQLIEFLGKLIVYTSVSWLLLFPIQL